MKRAQQLALILCAVVAIVSIVSHMAVPWLKIRAMPVNHAILGRQDLKPPAFLAGSSLAFHALNWDDISHGLGASFEAWGVAGSSPSEWEVFQPLSSNSVQSFIVVSSYDLNEDWLCDFHANVVPLRETIRRLQQGGASWPFCKRMLSQYPLMLARMLFPTAGRSDGVMSGIRSKFRRVARNPSVDDDADTPKFTVAGGSSGITAKITDWSPPRLERRLVALRNASLGKVSFDGLKKQALIRMLQQAERQGNSTLVMLPVSPVYQKEFLTADAKREIENELAEIGRKCPKTRVVRLDPVPALNDDSKFVDLVHMNMYGQELATGFFLNQVKGLPGLP